MRYCVRLILIFPQLLSSFAASSVSSTHAIWVSPYAGLINFITKSFWAMICSRQLWTSSFDVMQSMSFMCSRLRLLWETLTLPLSNSFWITFLCLPDLCPQYQFTRTNPFSRTDFNCCLVSHFYLLKEIFCLSRPLPEEPLFAPVLVYFLTFQQLSSHLAFCLPLSLRCMFYFLQKGCIP